MVAGLGAHRYDVEAQSAPVAPSTWSVNVISHSQQPANMPLADSSRVTLTPRMPHSASTASSMASALASNGSLAVVRGASTPASGVGAPL